MEEEKEKQTIDWCEVATKHIDSQLNDIITDGINENNIDYVFRLVDIHKDIANEIYWKEKIDIMYGNYGREGYGNYGREDHGEYGRRRRDSRGRYMTDGRGSYRGDDVMEEMYRGYQEYSEGRDNYGADKSTLQSLEKMLGSVKKFMKHLEKEATSQEEFEMIRETAKEISMM